MSQTETPAYAEVPQPTPSAPPFAEVEGWTSDQWVMPTAPPSEIQIGAFATGPGMLPDHPIGEHFVPMYMNIPEEHCLMPNSISPSMKDPSKCQHDLRGLTNPEIVGCDPLLNHSAEEITRFFLTHLKKPTVFVQPEGMVCCCQASQGLQRALTHYASQSDRFCVICPMLPLPLLMFVVVLVICHPDPRFQLQNRHYEHNP